MILIDIERCTNFSAEGIEKLKDAQVVLDKVLVSPRFVRKVLESSFRETGGLSNEQIAKIMREDYRVRVARYRSWKTWSRVVAYVTGRGGDLIHYHSKFFDHNTPVEVASTILHETAHLKGFGHAYKPWGSTVPYSMNKILEDVARELGIGVVQPQPVKVPAEV